MTRTYLIRPHDKFLRKKTFFLDLLDAFPEVGLLNLKVVLFSISQGMSIPFSLAAAPFHIPTSTEQEIQFLLKCLEVSFGTSLHSI